MHVEKAKCAKQVREQLDVYETNHKPNVVHVVYVARAGCLQFERQMHLEDR